MHRSATVRSRLGGYSPSMIGAILKPNGDAFEREQVPLRR